MVFKEIYHEHKNIVYNLALQYTQNSEDAEEITQDVFISVHEKLHTFQHQANIKTWIYRIAINKSLDFIKSKRRQKRFGFVISLFKNDGESSHLEISVMSHPGIEMENKEQLEILFNAINKLPDQQKTALILLKIDQKSQKEVAEIMEISAKAVESLFQRAKENLKSYLQQNEGR